MTPTTDQPRTEPVAGTDLVDAVQSVLRASADPLTLSKIRAQLPAPYRTMTVEELADILNRQVAVNVLFQYPKYRGAHIRYWDRPMPVHIASLLAATLQEGALPWSDLRRKLPAYARTQAEPVLQEQVSKERLYRHPRIGRGGERYGVRPAEARDYLRTELAVVFQRLEGLGFNQAQLREGALELLHEEEWAFTAPASKTEPSPEAMAPAREGEGSTPATEAQPPAPTNPGSNLP